MSSLSVASRERARFVVPDELRADVRLLGSILGVVIREDAGHSLYRDVERLRELTIAAHGDDPEVADMAASQAEQLVREWTWGRAHDVARAFSCYFHLTNLAEERQRVRAMAALDREGTPSALEGAYRDGHCFAGAEDVIELLQTLEVRPVLTAHPTEARRRAVVSVTRRIAGLLAQREDPSAGATVLAENLRRLHEEVDILWRTASVRMSSPTPLDEVRTAMTVFDETLFRVLPMVYRRLDDALSDGPGGGLPPRVPAFVRVGSWVGGDRDGNPNVTAAVTWESLAIQADHVLRALEQACGRVGRALTLDEGTTPASEPLCATLSAAARAHPQTFADISRTSPREPHRQALLLAARRIAGRRAGDTTFGYADVQQLRSDLVLVQESLVAAGAHRQAFGGLQELLWQVDTFGFHLAELEVRQHSSVHARALRELESDEPLGEETEEVLETFRTMARIQQRFGPQACRRYVVSFTHSSDDIEAVYRLARIALAGMPIELDVVPLFETADDLDRCVDVVAQALTLPEVRQRLAASDMRFEVMLGYSDSAKDIGPVSATLALDAAQAGLVAWAEQASVRLTLFHGRGGAVGRGGGPAHRAILGQAPGSLQGRLKVTEQGESVFARYGNPTVAVRHVEQVTVATLLASATPVVESARASADLYRSLADVLSSAARATYRELVDTPGFAEWFARVTPVEEIGRLPLGSRPARRSSKASSLADLRAIPWVFSWAQARVNLPGWFGLGSALEAVGEVDLLRDAWRNWPLFSVLLENAEMSLAKTDVRIMRRFLDLGECPELRDAVLREHARTSRALLEVTGQARLLSHRPALGRAVQLRNPYLDALSYMALHALRTLRSAEPPANRQPIEHLLLLAVSGAAAGLQNTG